MSGSSGMSGGGSTIDPAIRDAIISNYNFGTELSGQAYQPYTGQTVAAPNETQQAAWGAGQQLYNTGQTALGTTLSNLGQIQAASAPMVAAQQTNAPTAYNEAYMGAAQAEAPTQAYLGMGNYANPYENQVIANTAADMNTARQMSLGQNAQAATQAKAFGGSRHGVVDALTNQGFIQQVGNMAAGQRQQGFNTAAQLAGQDVASGLNLAGMNANMRQQAYAANQAASNQARQFGVSTGLGQAQQNAQFAQQAGLANQGAQQQQFQTALQAAQMTPGMVQSMYGNVGELANIGGQQQQAQQAQLDQAYQNFLEARNYPQQQLALRTQSLMGGFGGTYQPPQPVYRNTFGQMLGGAATGAGIGNMMMPGGAGAGWGAGIGLGLGLLGAR